MIGSFSLFELIVNLMYVFELLHEDVLVTIGH